MTSSSRTAVSPQGYASSSQSSYIVITPPSQISPLDLIPPTPPSRISFHGAAPSTSTPSQTNQNTRTQSLQFHAAGSTERRPTSKGTSRSSHPKRLTSQASISSDNGRSRAGTGTRRCSSRTTRRPPSASGFFDRNSRRTRRMSYSGAPPRSPESPKAASPKRSKSTLSVRSVKKTPSSASIESRRLPNSSEKAAVSGSSDDPKTPWAKRKAKSSSCDCNKQGSQGSTSAKASSGNRSSRLSVSFNIDIEPRSSGVTVNPIATLKTTHNP